MLQTAEDRATAAEARVEELDAELAVAVKRADMSDGLRRATVEAVDSRDGDIRQLRQQMAVVNNLGAAQGG